MFYLDILKEPEVPGEPVAVTKAKNMFAACMDTGNLATALLLSAPSADHAWVQKTGKYLNIRLAFLLCFSVQTVTS